MIFNPFLFLAGIVLGIFVVCAIRLKAKEVIRYPHPSTSETTVYRDKNNVCFKFKSEEVVCNDNKDKLKDYPLQN
jgi:hypothetical protein